jgi:hypothetical protein
MNVNNPVIKLCAAGMQAETAGRGGEAYALFMQAWEARADDYDACVAAHFVARYQQEPADSLRWNHVALERANAVHDDRVREFFPSLHLNMGKSHEELGDHAEARRYYRLAADGAVNLPDNPYGDPVRHASAEGLKRLAEA